jgi:toxin ParE1/3/4
MRNLLIQPQARLDLLEIWEHIARDSVPVANRVTEKLEAAILGLLAMPGKGHSRRDVAGKKYRFWSVYSYIIAYRYDDVDLIVIRVVHGHRNLRRMFRRER